MTYLRLNGIKDLRAKLSNRQASIGSWIQLPNSSVAEIMGDAGYDWVAVDLEHGAIDIHQLPDIFRALELGGTLPLVRLAQGEPVYCKKALDAGAAGVIVPMIESAAQLEAVRKACCWPPNGSRGVGFSRANLFGKYFDQYACEAASPLLIAMIENIQCVDNLEEILKVKGLDALFIGPYDLSASMGLTGDFENSGFINAIKKIEKLSESMSIPLGIHIVKPCQEELRARINAGYQFLAYSIDSVFLNYAVSNPLK